jgi:hypothetical protein
LQDASLTVAATAQMGRVFPAELVTINYSYFLEPTMLELLKSLVFAVVMVPVVMAVILGLIYGLGEVFNLFSGAGHKDAAAKSLISPAPGLPGVLISSPSIFER